MSDVNLRCEGTAVVVRRGAAKKDLEPIPIFTRSGAPIKDFADEGVVFFRSVRRPDPPDSPKKPRLRRM